MRDLLWISTCGPSLHSPRLPFAYNRCIYLFVSCATFDTVLPRKSKFRKTTTIAIMNLKTYLSLGVLLLASAGAPALARQLDDAVHQQAVSELIGASKLIEATLASMNSSDTEHPNRELMKHAHAHLTRKELMDMYVPIIAPAVSTEGAREIARAFATPAGKKMADAILAKSVRNSRAESKWSPADRKLLARFSTSPVYKQYLTVHQRTTPERHKALHAWLSSYNSNLYRTAYDALEAHFLAVDMEDDSSPPAFVPAHVGVKEVDNWIGRIAKVTSRNITAEWQFQRDMKQSGIETLLMPASLSSPNVVDNNHMVMEKLRMHNEAYLLELDLALQEYAATIRTVAPEGTAGALAAQKELDEQVKYNAIFAKHSRAQLDTVGRILQFARDRKGRLLVENGVLTMGKEDYAIYLAYAQQLEREMEESRRLVAGRTRQKSKLF